MRKTAIIALLTTILVIALIATPALAQPAAAVTAAGAAITWERLGCDTRAPDDYLTLLKKEFGDPLPRRNERNPFYIIDGESRFNVFWKKGCGFVMRKEEG